MNEEERKANPDNIMYSGDYHTNDSVKGTLTEKQRRILVEKLEKRKVNKR